MNPRTIFYSDVQDNQESEMDHDDDDREETEGKVVVPDTDEVVEDRFNHLFIEFMREKQYEQGHEHAVLLDEMFDRGLVHQ